MKNKKFLLGMLVMVLIFEVLFVGCSSTPKSFSKGSGGETTILLRQGLNFDQAFREAVFVLSRHGFETEMMNSDAGYIRTRWSYTWYDDSGDERYRVRILINFNPSRTQMLVSAPAEYRSKTGTNWVVGYDTRAIETLRTDLSQSIGN
jgi:ribosomal protein S17E